MMILSKEELERRLAKLTKSERDKLKLEALGKRVYRKMI
jgi:hypothetical protein